MKAKTYKIGDLVQWRYPRSNAIIRRKGYIVAIHECHPKGKGALVYDIQWFGHDQLDRMIETWFKPLTMEVQNEV